MCLDCVNAPNEIGSLVAWRPTDTDEYVPGQTVETICEDEKEYLIKWKNTSYYMSSWMSGAWVWGRTHASMRTAFARKNNGMNLPKMTSVDAIPEDYLRVDIVFDVKYTNVVSERIKNVDLARVKEIESALVKFKGLGYEDVVWEKRADADESERWADFKAAYDDWVEGHYVHLPVAHNMEQHINRVKKQNFAAKVELKEQPSTLTGGTLMEYQMEGLNWLLYQWHRGQNAILADEMGLGKTIQIIAFLTTLQHLHGCWPFLIVVPNATCANWRREIKQWAPSLRVVSYFGPKEARALAQKYELFHGKKAGDLKCHVVVTSYEAAQDEDCQKLFKRIKWAGLVVDEGQKLKNDNNIIYGALSALKMPFKVLLTGTPLQNNQRELFNLLQFLDPSVNAQALEEQYATLTSQNVPELHDLLRPFFLRRTKAQVLTFLPPMAQIIVPVTMTALQKKLYKIIIAKNADLLKSILGANSDKRPSAVKGLRNLLMQLRKCLCHPFVYNLGIEERVANEIVSHRNLVEAASKLQLLEIMLPKLKERGHRVLIFSQFLEMMTMMEDFMDGLGLQHLRLDGTLGSLAKQTVIDKFNAPDSTTFALLLSTRAGGVGINLATADTVIIMDPDFNPHQDIQAISRAHRIGQKKKVLVFQLMTRGSAEERIVQIGKKKMALDHILIERMEADEADGQDLESVLRFGAEALFKDDDSHDIQYDAASVDLLLDRSQMEDTQTGNDKSAESSFGFARVWANEAGTLEDGLGGGSEDETHANPSTWDRILEERARQAALDDAERVMTFGRGKRQRRVSGMLMLFAPHANTAQAIDYTKEALSGLPEVDRSDSDTDFQTRGEDSDGEDSGLEKNQAIDPIEQQDLEPHRSTSMVRETMPKPTPKATSTAGKHRSRTT
jgi:superfamily II DNA or RNA helicase